MSDLHVVFGAGGGAGGAVVRVLAGRGLRARAVTRGAAPQLPSGVEHVRADALSRDAVRAAGEDASVVYHCIGTPYATWADTLPSILDHLIGAAGAQGALLVYCDNLYMYGLTDGPLREDSAMRPQGPKGRLRRDLAVRLFEAHAKGVVRATSGRASDFFGPGAPNTVVGNLVLPAALSGGRARWLGSLDQPHSLNYIDDVGRQLAVLGTDARAAGEVWHLPAAPAITGRELIRLVFDVAGRPARMSAVPAWMVRIAGMFSRRMREIEEIVYQFEQPFILDSSRFVNTFGETHVTPMREAVEHTVGWARSRTAGTGSRTEMV